MFTEDETLIRALRIKERHYVNDLGDPIISVTMERDPRVNSEVKMKPEGWLLWQWFKLFFWLK